MRRVNRITIGSFISLVVGVASGPRRRIILSDSNVDVFHLFLIVTFIASALKWLLADAIDIILHVLDHLAVFLLTKDVVLLLRSLRLLQLSRFIVRLEVNLIVFLVKMRPVLRGNLES